jgi:hypothetical protein
LLNVEAAIAPGLLNERGLVGGESGSFDNHVLSCHTQFHFTTTSLWWP